MQEYILELIYLVASVLFIVGLKMLSHPETARRGNIYAAIGMFAAIFATIFLHENDEGQAIGNYLWIFTAMVIGTLVGWLAAKKVKMTAMPEMVSLFNGMGGACAALIGLVEYEHFIHPEVKPLGLLTVLGGLIIGSVSFSGSMVAFAKLNGMMKKDIRLPFYNIINTIFLIGLAALSLALILGIITDPAPFLYIMLAVALVYGILFVIPIGGADMPVVISLLNSFTGVAAAFGGFLYDNKAMLTGGVLVGSAGTILTFVMCKAMNRPLSNVVFGAFGGGAAGGPGGDAGDKTVKDINSTDAAILMNYSKKVIVVPGYGLAVAQAQHVIQELESVLEKAGVEVKYAIHPVAGRMPGHMNVLLAEANVDYSRLVEMEEINPEFATTDVVLVVGANDVVNPAAKTDPSSPIFGMPILEVENAKNVIVIKRGMKPGYAGIENELFYHEKTSMLFGDAKKVITALVDELKNM